MSFIFFIGRITCGIAMGITSVSCPTYIAEMASPHIRGFLGSGFQVMLAVGILYVDVVGAFVGWKWIYRCMHCYHYTLDNSYAFCT